MIIDVVTPATDSDGGPSQSSTSAVPSVDIDAILAERRAFVENVEAAAVSLRKAGASLEVRSRRGSYTFPDAPGVAYLIQQFDAGRWSALLDKSGLRTFLDAPSLCTGLRRLRPGGRHRRSHGPHALSPPRDFFIGERPALLTREVDVVVPRRLRVRGEPIARRLAACDLVPFDAPGLSHKGRSGSSRTSGTGRIARRRNLSSLSRRG